MRSQDSIALLEYEATRQPLLATMIANIEHLSEEAIQSAKVRLPWIRQALLKLKRERGTAAVLDSYVVNSYVPDPTGEMRQWTGALTFIRVGSSQLEITSGQLIWFGPNGVWIDTIHATFIDPRLRAQTVTCGGITMSGYIAAVRKRAQGLSPIEEVNATSAIRFYRPG